MDSDDDDDDDGDGDMRDAVCGSTSPTSISQLRDRKRSKCPEVD